MWRLKERSRAAGVTAAEVMTRPVVKSRRVKRLPVVDENGRLRGIISQSDVLSVFERPDSEIWDDVVKGVISGEFGLDQEMFIVTVRSGIVAITGSVGRRADGLGVLAAIRHLEAVVGLRDRLSYPPAV